MCHDSQRYVIVLLVINTRIVHKLLHISIYANDNAPIKKLKLKKTIQLNSFVKACFSISLITYFSISLLYRYFIEIPAVQNSANLNHQRELTVLNNTVQLLDKLLRQSTFSYAASRVSYDFLKQGGPYKYNFSDTERDNASYLDTYLPDNYNAEMLSNLRIDGVIITDSDDNIVLQYYIEPDAAKTIKIKGIDFNDKFSHPQIFTSKRDQNIAGQTSGILSTDKGPLFFSTAQVKNADQSGDYVGNVVFFKHIDQTFVDLLSTSTNLNLKLILESKLIEKYDNITADTDQDKKVRYRKRTFNDVLGNPAFALKIDSTRQYSVELLNDEMIMQAIALFLILSIVFFFSNRVLTNNLRDIHSAIEEMNDKNSLTKLPTKIKISEIFSLCSQFNILVDTLNSQRQHLEMLNTTDYLTNVSNRMGFESSIAEVFPLLERQQLSLAIIMVDVDFFKQYNDELGHPAGDEALFRVAQALQLSARRDSDNLARYGGEEFILSFVGINETDLRDRLQQLLEVVIEQQIAHPKSSISEYLTISVGAALWKNDGNSLNEVQYDELKIIADNALYKAKHAGRNCYQLVVKD